MPVTIHSSALKVKDMSTGQYVGVDGVSESTAAEKVAQINAAGAAKVAEVNAAGTTNVGNVNNAGTTNLAAINTRAQEVEASLPKSGEMEDMVAEVFVQSKPYPAGQLLIQAVNNVNKLYRLKGPHAAGDAWDASNAIEIKLGDEVSSLKSALTSLDEFCRKEVATIFTNNKTAPTTGMNSNINIVECAISQGQEFTIEVNDPDGALGTGDFTLYVKYSDSTTESLGTKQKDTEYEITASKTIVAFSMYKSGPIPGGIITTTVVYFTPTEDSLEERIEDIETEVPNIDYKVNELIEDIVIRKGYGLVPSWVKGDIDSGGNETQTNSYYRTPQFTVNPSKTYLMAQVTENAEGSTKYTIWTNTTYCVVHCYGSDNSHLGVSSPNTNGRFTPIEGTSYIKIGHSLINNLQVYETVSSYNETVTPTGYGDTTTEKLDDVMVQDKSVSTEKLNFMGIASLCIADKDTASPWYLYQERAIVSSHIPIIPGIYILHVNCTNLEGIYIYCFNSSYEQIDYKTMGSYSTPIKFELPQGTAYIKVMITESTNGALVSHITKFKIFGASATLSGYDDYKKVIESDKLPALPPLSLTGHAQGGIISMGHGGLSSVYAEDSIESFYGLARCGYEGSEVDIQFTSDNVPVCWHNSTLSVLNGATDSDHIYDYTLAQLDANFDFSSWWDTRSCFRKTVARFEEVCILARAYGWYIMPDKLTGASGAEEANMTALINMLKKYELGDRLIIGADNTALRTAFPNARLYLSAQTTVVDDAWANGVLRNVIEHCHTDEDENLIVDDDYIVYTNFNWQAIKESDGLQGCIDTYDVMVKHNIKTVWYTVESAEDIYQVVQYCPKTAIVLTGKYTIPDGVNEYIGIKWSNKKYDLSPTVHV